MAEEILGLDFEIHGGGSDLVFPHHENEIAQTEAARGQPLARLWMHNGMLQLDREKMSKSGGNITSLADALDEVGPEVLIMYFVGGHYRSPMPYSPAELEQARSRVSRIRELGRRLDPGGGDPPGLADVADRFFDALADDFNTPAALAHLFPWIARTHSLLDAGESFGPGRLAEVLSCVGLEGPARRRRGAGRGRPAAARGARGGARGARLRRGGRPPRRAGGTRLAGARHARGPAARARRGVMTGSA